MTNLVDFDGNVTATAQLPRFRELAAHRMTAYPPAPIDPIGQLIVERA
jgi:hypothetical protein